MTNGKEFSAHELVERHRALDVLLREQRSAFLSDWNGTHPFFEQFLGSELRRFAPGATAGEYIFLDERSAVTEAIRSFHKNAESLELQPANILAGSGSSLLLNAFVWWLAKSNHRKVYYIPPLYHSLHYFLSLLNITPIPVSNTHAFDSSFELSLPDRPSVLLLCDPVWFAGKHVPLELIKIIAAWQQRTGSLIMVDGSFQYLNWDDTRSEQTSCLDVERTFRLVCPTKALAIHAYRFAYLLHPASFHDDLTFLYESVSGGFDVGDLIFGLRALEVLSSSPGNRPLAAFLRNTFQALVRQKVLKTSIEPDCGYFVFAIPLAPLPNQVMMTQEYFQLTGYPHYGRVNLMVARQLYLDRQR